MTRLTPSRPGDKYVPSVDRLFESAAKHYGPDLLAVVLTGMGDDGRKGVSAVKACGGSVIAESESTAVIFGMPQQAIRTGAVDVGVAARRDRDGDPARGAAGEGLGSEPEGVGMSDERRHNLFARGEEFLTLFRRGAEFTKELLRENERLRHQLVEHEQEQQTAARNPEDWDKLRVELKQRLHSLEEECASYRERLLQVEDENRQFAERYLEIEEENNNLANLYVASYQLHSTLDFGEVLKIIVEIVINLIGAEELRDLAARREVRTWRVVAAEGMPP